MCGYVCGLVSVRVVSVCVLVGVCVGCGVCVVCFVGVCVR